MSNRFWYLKAKRSGGKESVKEKERERNKKALALRQIVESAMVASAYLVK